MIRWIKSWFCKHELEFVQNRTGWNYSYTNKGIVWYYGNVSSVWLCTKCDTFVHKDEVVVDKVLLTKSHH